MKRIWIPQAIADAIAEQRPSRFQRMVTWSPFLFGCPSTALLAVVTSPDLYSGATGELLLLASVLGLCMTGVAALILQLVTRYRAAAFIAGTGLCVLTMAFISAQVVVWYRQGVLQPKRGFVPFAAWEYRVPTAGFSLKSVGGHFLVTGAQVTKEGNPVTKVQVRARNTSDWEPADARLLHGFREGLPLQTITTEPDTIVRPDLWLYFPRELFGVAVRGRIQVSFAYPERFGQNGYTVQSGYFTRDVFVLPPTEQDFRNWVKATAEFPRRSKPIAVLLVMGYFWFSMALRAYVRRW